MFARIVHTLQKFSRWSTSDPPGLLLIRHPDVEADFSTVSIPDVFEEVVRENPHKTAISGVAWQPDYRTLNHAANRLAAELQAMNPPFGVPVAVLMDHDAPQVAAVLGVLKAGLMVTVLNPGDPAARLRSLLESAGAGVVVIDPARRKAALAAGARPDKLLVATPEQQSSACPNPARPKIAPDVAFLVYTSGSTGSPKGVMQTHAGIVHNAWRLASGMQLMRSDKLSLLASISGGQGLGTLFTALLNGATLCPFPIMERGTAGLGEWLRGEAVSAFISSASTFRHFMRSLGEGEFFPDIRLVRLASEHATSDDHRNFARRFPDTCRLMTTYSSSETGNITQGFVGTKDQVAHGNLPVGSPAAGMILEIHSSDGRAASAGEPGGIIVSGRHLAAGYWRNEALTTRHFTPDPLRPGHTRFHSGDSGFLNPAGQLVLGARSDQTVKVRGYRVDLPEVEHAIKGLSMVDDARVLVKEQPDGNRHLLAAVVPRRGHRMEGPQLRRDLTALLPSHMVPTSFLFLDELPLTPHGKVDREALLDLASESRPGGCGGPPVTEVESRLASIWTRVLAVDPVGRDDDFFDLGGDSLSGAVIAAHVEHEFGVSVDLRAFGACPTVATMARRLAADSSQPVAASLPAPAPCSYGSSLSFVEDRTWALSQSVQGSQGYTVVVTHAIRGPLNPAHLAEGIRCVMARHDILRTVYLPGAEGPEAVVLPKATLDFTSHRIPENAVDSDAVLASELAALTSIPFDLATPPLLRFRLLRVSEEHHLLLRCNHHIISDGWSWRVFFHELAAAYEEIQSGRSPVLPLLPFQYRDFAIWQRQRLAPAGALYQSQLAWWKEELAGAPCPLRIPVQPANREDGAPSGEGVVRWGLDSRVSRRLDRLAQQAGATYYAVRLAGYAACLGLSTGQSDFVMGTYASNRQTEELQSLFGFFSNLITLRFKLDPALTFAAWLRQVSTTVSTAFARADLPYAQLCDELHRAGSPPPEVRAIFSVNGRMPPIRFADLELSDVARYWGTMPWGCTLSFSRWREGEDCMLLFDAGLYDQKGMLGFLDQYRRFLDTASQQPDVPMAELFPAIQQA